MRLYYFEQDVVSVTTYPVALGHEKWRTPLANTVVLQKQSSPTCYVPKSIQAEAGEKGYELPDVVMPGLDNPLVPYAIYLGLNGYLIHRTTSPNSVGRLVSSGRIPMYNSDITDLYAKIKKGTPVYITYYPNKLGWHAHQLLQLNKLM